MPSRSSAWWRTSCRCDPDRRQRRVDQRARAYLEVLGDLLGVAAGSRQVRVIVFDRLGSADPVAGLVVAALILPVRCACCATHCGSSWRRRPTTSMSPTCARTWPRCQGRRCARRACSGPSPQASRRSPHTSLWIAQRSTSADRRRCWISCRGARNVVSTSSTRRSRWNRPTMPGMNRGRTRGTAAGYRGGTVPGSCACEPAMGHPVFWPSRIGNLRGDNPPRSSAATARYPLTVKERAIRQPTGHRSTSGLFHQANRLTAQSPHLQPSWTTATTRHGHLRSRDSPAVAVDP